MVRSTASASEKMEEVKKKIRRIENPAARQVTFSKRRRSLLKKAQELAVLCDASVGLVAITESGKVHEFSSTGSVKDIFPKYNDHSMKVEKHFDVKRLESENANDRNVTSNIRDKALEELTSSELGRIQGLLQSVRRERKLKEHITKLQAETKSLMEENKKLKEEMAEMLTGGSGGQPDAEPNSPEDDGSFDVTLRLGYL
ncbi:MADS-box transcription factor 47-like isoform X2 [Wolffia australiana]